MTRYWEVYLDVHHMAVAGYQLPDLAIQNALVFVAEQGSPVRNPFYRHREILNCYHADGTPIAYLGGGFLLLIADRPMWFHDYPNPADDWPFGWRRCIMTAPGCERFLRALHRDGWRGGGHLAPEFERGITQKDLTDCGP